MSKILVFPSHVLQSFKLDTKSQKTLDFLEHPYFQNSLFFKERGLVEDDESVKQIIPYIYLCKFDKTQYYLPTYFVYQRTKTSGESRLRGNYSLGIGGHTEEIDGDVKSENLISVGAEREVKEELVFSDEKFTPLSNTVGTIYDDSNAVGRVHFGLVQQINVPYDVEVKTAEDALEVVGFMDASWLVANFDKFENWSQILMTDFLMIK